MKKKKKNHDNMWLVLNQKLAAGQNLAIKKAFLKGKKKLFENACFPPNPCCCCYCWRMGNHLIAERLIISIPCFIGNIYIKVLVVRCHRYCIMQVKIHMQRDCRSLAAFRIAMLCYSTWCSESALRIWIGMALGSVRELGCCESLICPHPPACLQ